MRRLFLIILVLILCLSSSVSVGERKPAVKDKYYIGAMRVVGCKNYVSLREAPDKTSKVLAQVPLDAIVLNCSNNVQKYAPAKYRLQVDKFIRCEYEGQEGYILKKYLVKAPEQEPAESKAYSKSGMKRKDIIGKGKVILEWNEYNVTVLAAREVIEENGAKWEYLRVGCFIDNSSVSEWGYVEAVKRKGNHTNLRAFMGGTEDDPLLLIHDEQYGLTALDLLDGSELWVLSRSTCPLGDAKLHTVGKGSGILYVVGTKGTVPTAISSSGNVLWQADVNDPEIYGPQKVSLNPDNIEITYKSGKKVTLNYSGDIVSISDI